MEKNPYQSPAAETKPADRVGSLKTIVSFAAIGLMAGICIAGLSIYGLWQLATAGGKQFDWQRYNRVHLVTIAANVTLGAFVGSLRTRSTRTPFKRPAVIRFMTTGLVAGITFSSLFSGLFALAIAVPRGGIRPIVRWQDLLSFLGLRIIVPSMVIGTAIGLMLLVIQRLKLPKQSSPALTTPAPERR